MTLIAIPGAIAIHGAASTKSRAVLIISPPIGGRRLHAEPQKAQHSAEQNC
jgi:hypothetical protein